MIKKTLDWLNGNRFKAYPFLNNENIVVKNKHVPKCILLDCLVTDMGKYETPPQLIFTYFKVTPDVTTVKFEYASKEVTLEIHSTEEDPESLYRWVLNHTEEFPTTYMKFVFSSHTYIYNSVGEGEWNFRGQVLPSKVISAPISGVSSIKTNGSLLVNEEPKSIVGDIILEDGFRTQPVIQNKNLVVKVGTNYGIDPCLYAGYEKLTRNNCDSLLFFFCGQNAINSGSIVFQGGSGVSITQGKKYTIKKDIEDTFGEVGAKKGEQIPCVEITATQALLNVYTPSVPTSTPPTEEV